jgi:hypothetical protein
VLSLGYGNRTGFGRGRDEQSESDRYSQVPLSYILAWSLMIDEILVSYS